MHNAADASASTGRRRKGRILAIANQKGGVGKTTTAINLGTALASVGRRVLIVDLDPQGNASTGLGVERDRRLLSTYHLLVKEATVAEALVMARKVENLYLVSSTQELSGVDHELMAEADGRFRLRDALRDEATLDQFDYILVDCPPSLNLLTVNAMVAAHGVLMPLQCEFYALEGSSQLVNTIQRIRRNLNPTLGIQGVVMTMFDKRHKSEVEVVEDARSFFGDMVYETVIPRNVKIAEAPSHGEPVLMYDPQSPGALAYIHLATEVLARERDSITA